MGPVSLGNRSTPTQSYIRVIGSRRESNSEAFRIVNSVIQNPYQHLDILNRIAECFHS